MTELLDFFGSYDYLVRESIILVLVALGVYVLLNAGIFAVPQIGFMAIGAYASAILSVDHDVAFPLALLAGGAAGGIAGAVLGRLLMRLEGIYLALATIAFSEIVRVVIRNLDFTGGPQGLVGIPLAVNDVYILGIAGAALLLLWRLGQTRFGRATEAIREDPVVAAHQGIDIARYRTLLFALSGVLCGVGGALSAHLTGFVTPDEFTFTPLTAILAAAILGGMTSPFGALLGGAVIFVLPDVVGVLGEYRGIFNGAIIVLVIAIAPGGLVAGVRRAGRALVDAVRRSGSAASPGAAPADRHQTAPARPLRSVPVEADREGVAEPILDVRAVERSFGGVRALREVSLALRPGEVFGLIGPNGSGKTTLLNVVSGVFPAERGEIVFCGQSLARDQGHPDRIAARGIARTFQGIRLIGDRTVEENVMLGAYARRETSFVRSVAGLPPSRAEERRVRADVGELLAELGIDHVAQGDVASLPYGPQRKVEIARALVSRPRLLLLDEPTAGMTPVERREIFGLLQHVRARGISVVVVEHDVEAIAAYCDRAAVLNFGEVIALGRPNDILAEEAVIDAYIGHGTDR